MRIDQILPDFAFHDAIGSSVLQMRAALRDAGYQSEIWSDRIDPRLVGEADDFRAYRTNTGVLLYHLSTDGQGIPEWLVERASEGMTVACCYHNMTPATYFDRWEPPIAASLRRACAEMDLLAPVTDMAFADSAFNAEELAVAGYRRHAVTPLLVDLDAFHGAPDRRAISTLRRKRGTKWLFVGRLAPNKCQHEVIASFAVYRKAFDRDATLTLVGGPSSPRYARALGRQCRYLDLGDSVEFLEGLALPQLSAHYHASDVFVCLSEHEGFCVPLLEAMELELPIVAYRAAAVPDTLGGAGTLLDSKDPLEVACEVASLLSDEGRRIAVVAAGRERARQLSLPATKQTFLEATERWLAAQPAL